MGADLGQDEPADQSRGRILIDNFCIEVFTEGLQVDYWSQSFKCWAPACIVSVNQESGFITVNTRHKPLNRKEASVVLRPRTRPSERELDWVAEVLRSGHVESEARKLFERYATKPSGKAQPMLIREDLRHVGSQIDYQLGISGSVYELLRRAAKSEPEAEPPPGWEKVCSTTTGNAYYRHGQKVKWQRPGSDVALDANAFVAAFWEIVDAVFKRWGQALKPKERSLGDLRDMWKDYGEQRNWKQLGRGTFGEVFQATHRKSRMRRAIKKMARKEGQIYEVNKLDNEIGRLRRLDHPHIVKLYDCYQSDRSLYFAMDFCSGGDLVGFVRRFREAGKYVPEAVVANLMRQVMRAIAHIHARGLLHLDIKPANMVIVPEVKTMPPGKGADKNLDDIYLTDPKQPIHVMIIDLGLARISKPGKTRGTGMLGTPATMAPEQFRGVTTPAGDVFSCGATFFYLMMDDYPFQPPMMIQNNEEAVWDWWDTRPEKKPYARGAYSDSAYDLCDSMLRLDRRNRPTAAQCLHNNFFFRHSKPGEHMSPQVVQRLQHLATWPKQTLLYKSMALQVASSWPAYRLPSIRRAFEELDVASTGRLHKPQIAQTLINLGIDQELAESAADAMDLSRDGMVDWTEFVAACTDLGKWELEDDLWYAFLEMDKDGDGCLVKQDLMVVLEQLAAENLRERAASNAMFELVHRTDDRAKVDWNDFKRYFCPPGHPDFQLIKDD